MFGSRVVNREHVLFLREKKKKNGTMNIVKNIILHNVAEFHSCNVYGESGSFAFQSML